MLHGNILHLSCGTPSVTPIYNYKVFYHPLCKTHLSIYIHFRNKLSTWISQCAESRYAKSGGTATRLRDEGNAKFRIHDNEGAIRLYTGAWRV